MKIYQNLIFVRKSPLKSKILCTIFLKSITPNYLSKSSTFPISQLASFHTNFHRQKTFLIVWLKHSFIGASSRAINHRVARRLHISDGRVARRRWFWAPKNEHLGRFSKDSWHFNVNHKVDWIADEQEEVGEQNEQIGHPVVQKVVHQLGQHVQAGDQRQWDLHYQKYCHYDDQH